MYNYANGGDPSLGGFPVQVTSLPGHDGYQEYGSPYLPTRTDKSRQEVTSADKKSFMVI